MLIKCEFLRRVLYSASDNQLATTFFNLEKKIKELIKIRVPQDYKILISLILLNKKNAYLKHIQVPHFQI